jgi:hypothetical protein
LDGRQVDHCAGVANDQPYDHLLPDRSSAVCPAPRIVTPLVLSHSLSARDSRSPHFAGSPRITVAVVHLGWPDVASSRGKPCQQVAFILCQPRAVALKSGASLPGGRFSQQRVSRARRNIKKGQCDAITLRQSPRDVCLPGQPLLYHTLIPAGHWVTPREYARVHSIRRPKSTLGRS